MTLLKGQDPGKSIPVSFLLHLQRSRILILSRNGKDQKCSDIEQCLDTQIQPIPNSLSAPETLHIALTNACDQVCQGCFYSKGLNQPEVFLSDLLFAKILDHSHHLKVFQFAFGGGEPLLHPNILTFVKNARERNIVPNITTNGNLLSEELASEFRNAGLGQIQISLNGSTSEISAHTRPNHYRAVQAMEACQKVGLRFGINTLVTRENIQNLPNLFSLAERLGARGVNLLRPKPPVNASGWLEEVSLGPVQNRELHTSLVRENRREGIPVTLDQSLSFLAYHRNADDLYSNGVWGCGAGRRFLTIDPAGKVYPCSHYREPIGTNGDFFEAWQSSELLDRFRKLGNSLEGSCRDCKLVSVCRGCRAVVVELGGDFLGEDPHCPIVQRD
jgi:pyrroloquinoline quinone biosynthesis protein E